MKPILLFVGWTLALASASAMAARPDQPPPPGFGNCHPWIWNKADKSWHCNNTPTGGIELINEPQSETLKLLEKLRDEKSNWRKP